MGKIIFGNDQISKLFFGSSQVKKVYMGSDLIYSADNTETIQYCNNYIKNISSMTVSEIDSSTGNMTINFTPVTDTKVLNAVETGVVAIRVQLLVHAGSLRVKDKAKGKSVNRGYQYYSNCPTTAETDASRQSRAGQYYEPNWRQYWRKPKSHDAGYYGKTWLNLTKAQLQAGSATLTNVYKVLTGRGGQDYINNTRFFTYSDSTHGSGKYYDYAALLYIPALGISYSDPFMYHNQGYYKVSSNQVIYNQSTVS